MTRKITFMGLKKGMIDNQITSELKGCVSGETTQDYGDFVQASLAHIDNGTALHEVLLSDQHFALIRKNTYKRTREGKLDYEYQYYLCGVNDEQTYFVKLLPDFEIDYPVMPQSMDEIVNKVNKRDENYQRVQGDVLIKEIDHSSIFFENDTLPVIDNTTFQRLPNTYNKKSIFGGKVETRIRCFMGENIRVKIFGNHLLSTDGLIFINTRLWHSTRDALQNEIDTNVRKVLIINGTWLSLEHNQHKFTERIIPQRTVVMLEPQIVRVNKNQNYD